MKKILKQKKGITLIALVITVIVLLILAGISISMLSGDNGILQRATDAKTKTDIEQIKERIKLAYHSALAGGQGSYTKGSLEDELEKEFKTDYSVDDSDDINWKMIAHGQEVIIPAGQAQSSGNTYEIGQEVTVDGESFYVLESCNSNQNELILLSKYNLNQEGTRQVPNGEYADTYCVFSSNYYWAEEYAQYSNWTLKFFDINEVNGNTVGDAITKAQNYATAKGGTNGRLLTYEEANRLKDSYGNIIWGKANKQGENNEYYLCYWLSSGNENNVELVWVADGKNEILNGSEYWDLYESECKQRGTTSN